MSNFKNLLHGYPEGFHIPGSLLGIIKGFYHNRDWRDTLFIHAPYRKSPAESVAIKAELERMLALNINRPRAELSLFLIFALEIGNSISL